MRNSYKRRQHEGKGEEKIKEKKN